MQDDFTIGRDLYIFSSVEDLKEKVDYYLKHLEERKKIAEHGWHTVEQYNRINWAKKFLILFVKQSDSVNNHFYHVISVYQNRE